MDTPNASMTGVAQTYPKRIFSQDDVLPEKIMRGDLFYMLAQHRSMR